MAVEDSDIERGCFGRNPMSEALSSNHVGWAPSHAALYGVPFSAIG